MDSSKNFTPNNPSSQGDSRLHFLDYWRIIRIRKTVILAVFLLVLLTTTGVTFLLPKTYTSMVRIAVEKDNSDINPIGVVQNSVTFDPYFINTEFEKIKSKSVLYPVITNLNLNLRFGERYNNGTPFKISETYSALANMVDVRQTRNTSLIEIRVYCSDKDEDAAKEEAAEIANSIAKVYKETRLGLSSDARKRGIQTLQEQQKEKEVSVKKIQDELDVLKGDLQISDAMAEGAVTQMVEPELVRRWEAERVTVKAQYTGLRELLTKLQQLKEGSEDAARFAQSLLSAYPDVELGKLLQDLWFAQANLAKVAEVYGVEHPEYRQLAAMESDIDETIHARVEGILNGLELRVAAKEAELRSLEEAVLEAKQKEAEATSKYRPYFTKKRELEGVQRILDAIRLRVLQEQTDLAIPKLSIVEIVDPAEASERAVRPNVPLNITLGVIVGLVVGVGLAFFIEYLDTSVKTIDDVERALGAPVLGVIPQNVGSLIDEGPESPHAEAYRVLRTNIMFSRKRDDANTLTIVSGGAGEGKSTTIFNLCSIFAQNDQRVLLVDSDLRRPSLHKLFKVSNSLGLTNLLLGQNTVEEVIQTSSMPNLDFLPSGKLPSSSMGILNSPQMKEFINDIRKRYDWVFFDSPPIMGVSDASILCSMVDVTMLVIQYRKYPQAMTVRAKQMIEKIGGNLLGVVLNNINISQDSYYYYYSGYYYDYYSKRDDGDASSRKKSGSKRSRSSKSSRSEEGEGDSEIKQKF
ncbi:MAG: Tyrosine-protein kinase YwqD [Verrucomicrobiota bacterium]